MSEQKTFFPDLPEQLAPARFQPKINKKIWTEHKAQLIARYLQLFVLITKHGVYIDGFSGPKEPGVAGRWAAELVLANEPRWLREFFLCELDDSKIPFLQQLVAEQPPIKNRKITILPGDFNLRVDEILASGRITPKAASFCLLDQYTSECHWKTIKKLARHKPSGNRKIELFYFLGTSWLTRSLSQTTKNVQKPKDWWGQKDWRTLLNLTSNGIVLKFIDRFKYQLGYRYVSAWPITQHEKGQGKTMFFMIHASDHDKAPELMQRAYNEIVLPPVPETQISMSGF